MPAARKDSDDFEPIPNDDPGAPRRVRCLVCSTDTNAVDLLVTSVANHRRLSGRHKSCVATRTAAGEFSVPGSDAAPAVLALAERFSGYESDSSDGGLPRSGVENPFDEAMEYDDEIFDAAGEQVLFSAGTIAVDNGLDSVWKDMENLEYYDHTVFADMSPLMSQLFDRTEDCTVSGSVAAMAAMGIEDSDDEEEENDASATASDFDSKWAPHGSKTMFMLDLLDNLPRLRLSDDHLKAIIWVMKECGTPDVPSFYALRKMQAKLTGAIGLKPQHHTSALNNQFFMNHPDDLIRLDFANPLVRKFIHVYPEVTPTVAESWQAAKYVEEVELDELSPMWADWKLTPHRHFYVRELAECRNKRLVIPVKWIVYKNEVHAEAYSVNREPSGIFTVEDHTIIRILAQDLRYNLLDLRAQTEVKFSNSRNNFIPYNPHPVRAEARNRPAFVLRIMPWADDVSGNVSKQYNPHMNLYIVNVNLPHKLLMQEYFVHFCSTSPHAGSLELFDAMSSDCSRIDWKTAYDCELKQEILFRIRAHLLPADNPQQAESASTSGSSSTFWCREDDSGGSATYRESNEGYHALFSPGNSRKPEETIRRIKEQIKLACRGVSDAVERLQKETGVKDKIALHWIDLLVEKAIKIQKERLYNHAVRDPRLSDKNIKGEERQLIKDAIVTEIQEELFAWVILQPEDRYEALDEDSRMNPDLRPGDHFNVLLSLRGLDPHRDSPCEILHTYLLGEDKYAWHETTKVWTEAQGDLFAARLQSASIDGLNISALRAKYVVQYKKSLIGRHFKGLQQLAVFQLDEKLCSTALFELWKANGVLGALLWYPEITNMEQYLADLSIAIDNVLDRWAIVDPTRIMVKYKLHVLPHIPEGVRRFGPSILFATEIFECWNTVFRLCSVLSNHQAPSLDIATTLADMERFKHQVSGGWWKSEGSDDWIQAGPKIRDFLISNKQLQRRLGWTPPNLFKPGTIKRLSKAKRKLGSWKEILGLHWNEQVEQPGSPGSNTNWIDCKYVVARSEDICFSGSWVFFADITQKTLAGRIAKILIPETTLLDSGCVVVMEHFAISDANDARLNMPLLIRTANRSVIKPKDILFKFNAQHDCRHFSCPLVQVTGPNQERRESKLAQKLTAHSDDSRFHLNMHALHNAHLIRETLPRNLTELKPCFTDRRAKHDEFAAKLRETGPQKRAQAQAKGQETKLKNKQDKANKVAGAKERAS